MTLKEKEVTETEKDHIEQVTKIFSLTLEREKIRSLLSKDGIRSRNAF